MIATMATTEIPQKFWQPFCDQLNDWQGVVNIQWTQPDGTTRAVAENAPLQRLVFQKRNDECSDMMMVETGTSAKHQIVEPFSLVLRKNAASGHFHELEILSETGKTEITFTPGIEPGLLEKLGA
jgi:hypothetical protein